MNKFPNGKVFVIMNDSDVTNQVTNLSLSRSKDQMPSKVSVGVTKRLVEFDEPAPDIVSTYQWYTADEVLAAWEALP